MGVRRDTDLIDLLVLHSAASPDGAWVSAEDVDDWHRRRGYSRDMSIATHHAPRLPHIGFHYLILTTGAVECGRPLQEACAATPGHNRRAVSVCLVGTARYSARQWSSLARLVEVTRRRWPRIGVVGAGTLVDVDEGGPGFDVEAWIAGGMSAPPAHLLPDDAIGPNPYAPPPPIAPAPAEDCPCAG